MQLWDCRGGADQRWTDTAGPGVARYGNKCLDGNGRGTTNGTAVIVWDCNGQATSSGTSAATLPSPAFNPDRVWTWPAPLPPTEPRFQLCACHGGTNQQWSIRH